jgi:hypothetical protein
MKTIHTSDKHLEVQAPKSSAFTYETAPNLPKLHQNMLIIGARGAGKSVAACHICKLLNFHRIFAISPTMRSNRDIMSKLKIDPQDVFEDPDDVTCIDSIKRAIEKEAEDLDTYREQLKRYNKMMETMKSASPITSIADDDLEMFFERNQFLPPKHKWNGERPRCALLCDDCMGSNLFTKGARKLNAFVIKHRHIGQLESEPTAIGCSCFWLLQSYLSQHGGISKTIRNNATSIILFKTKSEKALDEISLECAGEVSKEDFMSVYETAIQKDHDFLFIDFFKKASHPSMFRRNFTEFIML